MTVKAWLNGHPFDLDALVALLPSGDTQVVRDDDGSYYLTAKEIDGRPAHMAIDEAAAGVLQRVNGLARVHDPGYRPVALAGRYQEKAGALQVHVTDEVRIRDEITVFLGGERLAPPPSSGPVHAALAESDPAVADALAIMGQPEPLNWAELYKVYEIIEHTGQLTSVGARAGIASAELERFRRTANHPAAVGLDARHGRSKTQPPKSPMPIGDARLMMSSMMRIWMDLRRE